MRRKVQKLPPMPAMNPLREAAAVRTSRRASGRSRRHRDHIWPYSHVIDNKPRGHKALESGLRHGSAPRIENAVELTRYCTKSESDPKF